MTSSSRRQLFRRSKAGCWNCRSKKKKCDESRPHCTRCIRAGESCRYPSESGTSPEPVNSSLDYVSPPLPSVSSFGSLSILQPAPSLSRQPSSAGSRSLPVDQHLHYHNLQQEQEQQQQHHHHYQQHPHSYSHSHPSIPSTWDEDAHQQHPPKRGKYDDLSSSSASSRSSSANYQDHYGRSHMHSESHERLPSSSSYEAARNSRDLLHPVPNLPPLSSVPMMVSASMPALEHSRRKAPMPFTSPNQQHSSVKRSPNSDREHPYGSATATAATTTTSSTASFDSHLALSIPFTTRRADIANATRNQVPPSPEESLGKSRLVLDYDPTDLDPHVLLQNLDFISVTTVTQVTKGAKAFFTFLHDVAKMSQGQAVAHALAAMTAIHQANFAKANHAAESSTSTQAMSDASQKEQLLEDDGNQSHHSTLLDLADRHFLAAIKALQNQHTPSRRRRFSIIDAKTPTDDLPVGTNAAVMILLILACNLAGKSLMLPSYLQQCEQFLIDAIEQMSSHRMFPSVTAEICDGTPESPPPFDPQNLPHFGLLLIMGTYVGLYEVYLAQYVAVTDWNYNPAKLKRLQPYNWADSDAEMFNATRRSVAETTYSVSMVTMELVLDTLDTVRKFKRAENAVRGQRSNFVAESDDSVAGLESLALRQEVGLLIKDLEAGAFWKGAARTFSPSEEREVIAYLDSLSSDGPVTSMRTPEEAVRQMGEDDVTSAEKNGYASALHNGNLFVTSTSETGKRVNRIRLGNHLFRNALIADLYISVFNLDPSTVIIQKLVSSSIQLLKAVPEMLELGLMWPVLVLGSHATEQGEQRAKVRAFLKRSQWKGSAGPFTAEDVLERVWQGSSVCWREGVKYFGNPLIT